MDKSTAERIAYRVDELAAMLGISHKTIRREIDRGLLRAFKIGNAVLIPKSEVERKMRGEL